MIHDRMKPLLNKPEKEESKVIDIRKAKDISEESQSSSEPEPAQSVQSKPVPLKVDPATVSASPNSIAAQGNGKTNEANRAVQKDEDVLLFDGKAFTGEIKFFNVKNKYGFILQDDTKKDVFFHYEDIKKTKISKKMLKKAWDELLFTVSYQVKAYSGKKDASTKAVNIKVLSSIPRPPKTESPS